MLRKLIGPPRHTYTYHTIQPLLNVRLFTSYYRYFSGILYSSYTTQNHFATPSPPLFLPVKNIVVIFTTIATIAPKPVSKTNAKNPAPKSPKQPHVNQNPTIKIAPHGAIPPLHLVNSFDQIQQRLTPLLVVRNLARCVIRRRQHRRIVQIFHHRPIQAKLLRGRHFHLVQQRRQIA